MAAAVGNADAFGVAAVAAVGAGIVDRQQDADRLVLRIVNVHLETLKAAQVPLARRGTKRTGPSIDRFGRDFQRRLAGVLRYRRLGLDRTDLDLRRIPESDDRPSRRRVCRRRRTANVIRSATARRRESSVSDGASSRYRRDWSCLAGHSLGSDLVRRCGRGPLAPGYFDGRCESGFRGDIEWRNAL